MTPPAPGPSVRLVLALFVVLGVVFALINPLPHLPDEGAHEQYIAFLAQHHQLPLWQPTGGEAGYESQHPPLSYLLYVPAYWLLDRFGPLVRAQGLRFAAVAVGLFWLLLCRHLYRRLFGPGDRRVRYALATVAFMPLVLLYACHTNPDLVVGIGATATLWLAWEQLTGPPNPRRAAALGAVAGLTILTKLSGAATLAVVLVAMSLKLARTPAAERRPVWRDAALALGVVVLLLAPYLARNEALYGTLVTKTVAPYGTALHAVERGRATVGELLLLTVRNTYLSSWSQPDWLPGWPFADRTSSDVPFFPVVLFYGAITLFLVMGVAGWLTGRAGGSGRAGAPAGPEETGEVASADSMAGEGAGLTQDEPLRDFARLTGVLLVAVLIGHQLAFWTQDIEFNMGGRYVLSAMAGIVVVVVAGLDRWRQPRLLPAWLGLLLVLDVVAALNILFVLNPHYSPGWKVLTLK